MGIEIRTATPDDFAAAMDVMSTAFLERPDVDARAEAWRAIWDPARLWIAWDGSRACGTFRSWATEVTVPGLARLPAGAIAGVTVLPTHRRQGILRRLAAAEHAAARERGEAVALLYASEFGIYGRFGYGPATRVATWTVDRTRTAFSAPPDGRVELVHPDERVRTAVRELFDGWRREHPGEIARRDYTWAFRLGLSPEPWSNQTWRGFVALHRDPAGVLDGFARYTAQPMWADQAPRGLVEVEELFGRSDEAEAGLWSFLGSLDLVGAITAKGRSPSERLPWRLTNERAARVSDVGDGLWARLFDVPRALEARTYERDGRVVLDVLDDEAAGGRWRVLLDVEGGRARCTTTTASPDVTLPVAALGSVYLGAHDLRDVALRLPVDAHREGVLDTVAGLFRTAREPACSTFF